MDVILAARVIGRMSPRYCRCMSENSTYPHKAIELLLSAKDIPSELTDNIKAASTYDQQCHALDAIFPLPQYVVQMFNDEERTVIATAGIAAKHYLARL